MNNKLEPILIINLARAVERRERITTLLSKLNLEYIIIDAIDNLILTDEEKNKFFSYPNGYRFGEKFKPGEIACTMSHIKALQYAKDQNLKYALILEDDTIVSNDFEKRVNWLLSRLSSNWEHVFLSGQPQPRESKLIMPNNMLRIEKSKFTAGAYAMMVHFSAYDKLINTLSLFQTTVDDVYSHLLHNNLLNSYTYYPFCAYTKASFSYIWNLSGTDLHYSYHLFKDNIL